MSSKSYTIYFTLKLLFVFLFLDLTTVKTVGTLSSELATFIAVFNFSTRPDAVSFIVGYIPAISQGSPGRFPSTDAYTNITRLLVPTFGRNVGLKNEIGARSIICESEAFPGRSRNDPGFCKRVGYVGGWVRSGAVLCAPVMRHKVVKSWLL